MREGEVEKKDEKEISGRKTEAQVRLRELETEK